MGSGSGSGNFIAGSGNALCILFPTLLAEDQAWMESGSDSDRKSMQTWSSWHKLKRFFQNQMKVLHLLKKQLL
nr:hypothetical protein [Tanacetum cinerariifolium]